MSRGPETWCEDLDSGEGCKLRVCGRDLKFENYMGLIVGVQIS